MMDDPRTGPYLSDVLAGKDPRDVLAERIETWADTEDWHVYDYVDRLLADLDAAGWEITRREPEAWTVVGSPQGFEARCKCGWVTDHFLPTWKLAHGVLGDHWHAAHPVAAVGSNAPASRVAADPTAGTGT